MRKTLAALVILAASATAAYARCSSHTYYVNGKIVNCTTCCYSGTGCSTTCY
jgi:hypothetical protein